MRKNILRNHSVLFRVKIFHLLTKRSPTFQTDLKCVRKKQERSKALKTCAKTFRLAPSFQRHATILCFTRTHLLVQCRRSNTLQLQVHATSITAIATSNKQLHLTVTLYKISKLLKNPMPRQKTLANF